MSTRNIERKGLMKNSSILLIWNLKMNSCSEGEKKKPRLVRGKAQWCKLPSLSKSKKGKARRRQKPLSWSTRIPVSNGKHNGNALDRFSIFPFRLSVAVSLPWRLGKGIWTESMSVRARNERLSFERSGCSTPFQEDSPAWSVGPLEVPQLVK